VVRLGERYRNQIQETGHDKRLEDLDRIAAEADCTPDLLGLNH
jgi:hypothetical protein